MNRIILAALVASHMIVIAPAAMAWDVVMPPETGRSYVSPGIDGPRYDTMRACLNEEFESGAEYWAAIVDVSDRDNRAEPSANDAVPFVDYTYQLWRDSGVEIDPKQHVLIGLGLKNRAVAIHPGGRWAAMGFEKSAITSAIDRSPFKQHARAGNYEVAVCELARSVDAHLVRLIQTEIELKESLEARIESERQELASLREKLRDMPLEAAVINAELVTLEGLELQLDRAERHFDAEAFIEAQNIVNDAEVGRDGLERKLDRHAEATMEFDRVKTRSEALRKEATEREDALLLGVGDTFMWLDRCDQRLEQSRKANARLQPPQIYTADHCLDDARRVMNNADLKNLMLTRVLPTMVLFALLVLLLFWLFRRHRRRLRAVREFEGMEGTWDKQLGVASDRLLDLERSYPSYFGPSKVAWDGQSQALDQACADAVNEAFLLLNEAMDRHSEARELVDQAGPFDFASVERANRSLTVEEVVFETGEKETRRRIFLPLTREYRGFAGQLLHDLQQRYVETRDLLDRVTEVEQDAIEAASDTQQLGDSITELADRRAGLGGDPAVLIDPAEAPLEKCFDASRLAVHDPIAAQQVFDGYLPGLREIEERGELGNSVLIDFDEIAAPLGRELVAEIARLRGEGMRLKEDGFHPDVMLEQARASMADARRHVVDGEETLAKAVADRVHAILQDVRAKVEASVAGRDDIPGIVEEQRAIRATIADRLPAARATLEELEAEHAPESFEPVTRNAAESDRLLAGIPAWCDGIVAAHADQAYLSAWTDVDAAWTRLRTADQMIDALHARLEQVTAARDECQRRQAQVEDRMSALGDRDGDAYVGAAWREDFTEAKRMWADATTEMQTEYPDWPECAALLNVVWGDLESLLKRADRFEQSWREAKARFDDVERKLEGLNEDVRREVRDRPHVGRAVSRVEGRRNDVEHRLSSRDANGDQILASVETLQGEYKWAMGVWATEMRLIQHANAELSRVESIVARLKRTSASYGYGVVGDFTDAQRLIYDARELADARSWEKMLEKIDVAESVAEAEDERCEDQADSKRRAAQRAARLARQRSSSSSSSYSSSSSFSSSSSSSSGSSFSSSSGGSSFGSSSGGSSW